MPEIAQPCCNVPGTASGREIVVVRRSIASTTGQRSVPCFGIMNENLQAILHTMPSLAVRSHHICMSSHVTLGPPLIMNTTKSMIRPPRSPPFTPLLNHGVHSLAPHASPSVSHNSMVSIPQLLDKCLSDSIKALSGVYNDLCQGSGLRSHLC